MTTLFAPAPPAMLTTTTKKHHRKRRQRLPPPPASSPLQSEEESMLVFCVECSGLSSSSSDENSGNSGSGNNNSTNKTTTPNDVETTTSTTESSSNSNDNGTTTTMNVAPPPPARSSHSSRRRRRRQRLPPPAPPPGSAALLAVASSSPLASSSENNPSSSEAFCVATSTAAAMGDAPALSSKQQQRSNNRMRHTKLVLDLALPKSNNHHHHSLIKSLLEPIPGVEKVTVVNLGDGTATTAGQQPTDSSNGGSMVQTSEVNIHHDEQLCQSDDLLRTLGQAGYPSSIMEGVVDEHDKEDYDDSPDNVRMPSIVASLLLEQQNNKNNNNNPSPPPQSATVRSTFLVQGICCATEVSSVRRIVRPMSGVASLQVNLTTKHVYVQHEPSQCSAADISERLTQQGFASTIVHNGGQQQSSNCSSTGGKQQQQSTVGRTTLHAEKKLQDSDVPILQKALAALQGVIDTDIQVSENILSVQHDIQIISATDIVQTLMTNLGYKCRLVQDAQSWLAQHEQTAAVLAQPRSNLVESTLYATNLTHRHVPVVHKAIQQHYSSNQVRAVHPHVSSRTLKVEHNPAAVPIVDLCQTLTQYGLDVSIVTDGAHDNLILPLLEGEEMEQQQPQDDEENGLNNTGGALMGSNNNTKQSDWQSATSTTSQIGLHVIFSGIFWVVALLSAVEGWERLEYFGILSVLCGLPPVMVKAWRTIRRCEFDSNGMMVTAALGALALRELDEAASVAFLFAISEFLEARATHRARTALEAICRLRPEHAHVFHPETKQLVVVPADGVPVGSLVSVRTGDKVPADGVVVEGTSHLDESSLTGESVPVLKGVNDVVSGGGINVGTTQLVIRTTTSVQDSAVSRLIRLVEEAQANRSPTETMVDGFARAYTPAVIGIAALVCTLPWLWGHEQGRYWTLNGLIIIVIACPCALTISTPVTYAAALAATAQRGIVVKGGASLELLGAVKTVLFDKTGTLTEGKFKIQHLEEVGDTQSRREMLELLAIMEAPSSHPLSATLVQAARQERVSMRQDMDVREHSMLKGEGVTALVNNKRVYVGNVRLFDRIGMYEKLTEDCASKATEWNRTGGSVGFIGVEGEGIIGMFCVTDTVRPESREVVESLLSDGVDVHMLTGDGEGAARSVALQVGLANDDDDGDGHDRVHAKLLPEDKLHHVSSAKAPAPKHSFGLFRRQPRVLFVGDGVNDAPALAAADVGISMGEGASLAMEMSDVTLMDSNLHKLLYVMKMGSRAVFTIQENILLSLACKLVVVVLTFMGYMTLLFAIASDVGVMLIVTLNGMKLLPGDADGGIVSRLRHANRRRNYRQVASRSTEMVEPGDTTTAALEDDDDESDIHLV